MPQHRVMSETDYQLGSTQIVRQHARQPDREEKIVDYEDIFTVADPDNLPALTPAELKCQREYLGLSTAWMAEKLVIGERRIQRMESGQEPIVEPVIKLIDQAQADALDLFNKLMPAYRRKVKAADGAPAILPTYRTDTHGFDSGLEYPARWHRHVAARIADGAPGAIIMYADQTPAGKPGDDE